MKIWIKYLIGIALGIIAAFVLPENLLTDTGIVSFLSDIAIRTVRFLLVPLVFFSFTVAVFKLRDTKKFFKNADRLVSQTPQKKSRGINIQGAGNG